MPGHVAHLSLEVQAVVVRAFRESDARPFQQPLELSTLDTCSVIINDSDIKKKSNQK
jgi:hypothetical protein